MQPINQLIVRKKINKMADNPNILTGFSTQPISFSKERMSFVLFTKVFEDSEKKFKKNRTC